MFSVQPVSHYMRDEELAAVRVWSRIRHRKRTHLVPVGIIPRLVLEAIAGSPASRTLRIAPLNHEVVNDSMKRRTVIETISRQEHKIIDRFRSILSKKINNNAAARCL